MRTLTISGIYSSPELGKHASGKSTAFPHPKTPCVKCQDKTRQNNTTVHYSTMQPHAGICACFHFCFHLPSDPHPILFLHPPCMADEPAAPRGRKIGAGKKATTGTSKTKGKSKGATKGGLGGGRKGKTKPIPDFPTADGGCS